MTKLENFQKRTKSLETKLKNDCPHIFKKQKHLDEGIERNYWHYGYLMALKDIDRNFGLIEKLNK